LWFSSGVTSSPEGQRDRTKALLNGGIAATFTLSLLSNLVRATFEDRTSAVSEGRGLVLLVVPSVLFLLFVIARLGLPLLRRLTKRRDT